MSCVGLCVNITKLVNKNTVYISTYTNTHVISVPTDDACPKLSPALMDLDLSAN